MVITPSFFTLPMASAISLPTALLLFAEIEATCSILSKLSPISLDWLFKPSTIFTTALSRPLFKSIGLAPAATFLNPVVTIDCAKTVAVVVPSPARSLVFDATSFTICAPMFSIASSSSISLATVTPSLVTEGAPKDLSIITLRPLGPRVTFTAFESASTPFLSFSLASRSNMISFAIFLNFIIFTYSFLSY